MHCVSPPELSDRDLLAYLDDEADEGMFMHIERCPYCRTKAQSLAHLQDDLTARLYRVTCPPSLELGEYHLGLLTRPQMAAIAQHLGRCPHCTREVAQLQDYLAELAPSLEPSLPAQIGEQVKVLIARLVEGGSGGRPLLGLAPTPAYAGIRGQEEAPQVYQAGDVQVIVETQKDAEQPDRCTLLGLVTGLEAIQLEVHLWREGQRVVSAPVYDLGNFVVADLTPATYDLILSSPETEIHISGLDVTLS